MNGRAALAAAWLTATTAAASAAAVALSAPTDAEVSAAYDAVTHGFFDLEENASPSPDELELGRKLFFDPRLSSQGTLSCASCHHPGLSWTDGQPRALGLRRRPLDRNTPSLLNIHRNLPRDFRWDGSSPTLESVTRNALTSRIEMRADPRAVLAAILRLPGYTRLFERAYGPTGAGLGNAVKAMAAYVRVEGAKTAGPTAFDRFATDRSALGPREKLGLTVFAGKGKCLLCHSGPFFSDDYYHNTGLAADPRSSDAGRYAVEPGFAFWRAFKTPPLRGVAESAPYMQDGRFRTLREVVDFYSRGGDDLQAKDHLIEPLNLTEDEKDALVAFLRALSPPRREVTPPSLPTLEEPASAAEEKWRIDGDAERLKAYAAAKDWIGVAAQAEVLSEELARRSGADEFAKSADALARVDGDPKGADAMLAAFDAARERFDRAFAAADPAADAEPKALAFPFEAADPSWLYYRGGETAMAAKEFVFPGADAYPRVVNGELLPPKAYEADKSLSKADWDKMKRGLKVAKRYADVNAAFADGYRLEEKYGKGMGIHMHNLAYETSGALEIEKPQFLTYVRGRGNGKYQLIQLGYIHRGMVRQKMFDSPDARGHFHDENICVAVRGNVLRTVPENTKCDAPDETRLGPIWMMHFAVPIYNEKGLFADDFVYADHASLTGELHTFFGRSVP